MQFFKSVFVAASVGALSASAVALPEPKGSVLVASNAEQSSAPFVPNRRSDPESIADGKARAKTSSPTSDVKGLKFDNFHQIWFENTDAESAWADPGFQWVMSQGITLTNYFGITHPSQPNYAAAVSGSQHHVLSGIYKEIPKRVKTVVDLLDKKGISWGEYQEGMPYSGFKGNYHNQENGRNDYVRKHNPLVMFESVAQDLDRLSQIKNMTLFYKDLEANKLPQWSFITPNMTNDGHDSSVRIAGKWAKDFLKPLVENPNFMKNTLVIVTFDESERYLNDNKVFAVLLGDAVPAHLRGTKDSIKYNHYSNLVTVEKNWDLGFVGHKSLGDRRANAFYPFNPLGDYVQDNETHFNGTA